MAGRRRGWEAEPLVGPGTELQLTLDGGAVPHVEVVAQAWEHRDGGAAPAPAAAPRPA